MAHNYRLISFLALLIACVGYLQLHKPHSIDVRLAADSAVTVPADRATISLQVFYESSKQTKAAEMVRQTTDEILGLLRPLTLPPDPTVAPVSNSTEELLPPIATLSVDAFSLNSRVQPGVILEQTIYSSSVRIQAEFRSLVSAQANSTRTATPGEQFRYLSLVLPSLTSKPHTRIEHLRWFLSPENLAKQEATVRRSAMNQMLTKIDDYTGPMNLKFPIARCLTFRDEKRYGAHNWYDSGVHEVISYSEIHHDELGGLYDIDRRVPKAEAFGMEPKSIDITVRAEADWRIDERGWAMWLLEHIF